jgi:hypothetical protein
MAKTPEQCSLEQVQRRLTENKADIEDVVEAMKELGFEIERLIEEGGAVNLKIVQLMRKNMLWHEARLSALRQLEGLLSVQVRLLTSTAMAGKNAPPFLLHRRGQLGMFGFWFQK